MQLVHKKLSDFSGNSDPLLMVVKNLSKDYKIIFLDEFQIEDIADAMIIGTLIESLTIKGTRLMITSNSHPDDLYKNGLQRAKFLKTINFINNNFSIHHLLGAEDYRLREIAHFDSSANDKNSDINVRDFLQRTFNSEITNKTKFSHTDEYRYSRRSYLGQAQLRYLAFVCFYRYTNNAIFSLIHCNI